VTFITGNILEPQILRRLPVIDAAFFDPDWAVTGHDHEYRFQQSNTKPLADTVLRKILEITDNVAIISLGLPYSFTNSSAFSPHSLQRPSERISRMLLIAPHCLQFTRTSPSDNTF
jgi:hypothetical protein